MLTNRGVAAFEFAFIRSCFNAVASAFLVKFTFKEKFFASIPRELRTTVLLRAGTGTVAFYTFVSAPKYIPLGIFFVLFNS